MLFWATTRSKFCRQKLTYTCIYGNRRRTSSRLYGVCTHYSICCPNRLIAELTAISYGPLGIHHLISPRSCHSSLADCETGRNKTGHMMHWVGLQSKLVHTMIGDANPPSIEMLNCKAHSVTNAIMSIFVQSHAGQVIMHVCHNR